MGAKPSSNKSSIVKWKFVGIAVSASHISLPHARGCAQLHGMRTLVLVVAAM